MTMNVIEILFYCQSISKPLHKFLILLAGSWNRKQQQTADVRKDLLHWNVVAIMQTQLIHTVNNKQNNHAANMFLTMNICLFPPRPLPLSPLRYHGASICIIVQTVPAACCFSTTQTNNGQMSQLTKNTFILRHYQGSEPMLT